MYHRVLDGVGAVLSHHDESNERPIAYASRTLLNQAESKILSVR